MSKRKTLAVVAAVAAFAAVSASAASLGGLTGTGLGADFTAVASCDTSGIGVNYTTAYNAPTSQYVVSAVNLTLVDANCNLKAAQVTLSDAAGASLGSATVASLPVTAGNATISLGSTAPAKTVANVAVVISG